MAVTTTVKVFIDVFIGIWAFVLAWIWSAKIEPQRGDKVKARDIWERFPKFVLGYAATFADGAGDRPARARRWFRRRRRRWRRRASSAESSS